VLHAARWKYWTPKQPKCDIWAPSRNFVELYLRLLASLGHPDTFQRLSRLGSVTARHSNSGRQPNFAALNRARHLYSAGRPSRWVLAHISSLWPRYVIGQAIYIFCILWFLLLLSFFCSPPVFGRAPPVFGRATITLGTGPHI